MIENKHIQIGDNSYRLTIEKKRLPYSGTIGYVAYLSDVDSQFTTNKIFKSLEELERELRVWIMQSDILNDPEARIFKQLEKWDGVINV